jgi:ketosteroid isomerase-like protein
MTPHNTIQQPVDGSDFSGDTTLPRQALAQFYKAFNSQDMVLMEQIWEQSEEAVLANPLGGIKRGWKEIRPVYERIFGSKTPVRVEFYDYTLPEFVDIFYAVGRERPLTGSGESDLQVDIRTTRIYHRQVDGKWKLIHYHGSFDDAELLAKFQATVR